MRDLATNILSVFLILLGWTTGSYINNATGIDARITPSNPIFASGSNMTLYCSLTKNDDASMNISSGSLKFSTDNVKLTDSIVSSVHNDTTLQLMVTGVTRSISSSNISCLLNDTVLDTIMITVADKPRTPNITECRVYNWKMLTCIWELQDTGIETNVSLMWRRSRTETFETCKRQSVQHGYGNCTWISMDGTSGFMMVTHYLHLTAQNALGSVNGREETFNVRNLVEPDPVSNVSVKVESSTSAVVSWTPPHVNKLLLYRISYESPVSGANVTYKNSSSIVLEDLIPLMTYEVIISCIPLIRIRGPNYNATGFWSKNSSITFTTLEDGNTLSSTVASTEIAGLVPGDAYEAKVKLSISDLGKESSSNEILEILPHEKRLND